MMAVCAFRRGMSIFTACFMFMLLFWAAAPASAQEAAEETADMGTGRACYECHSKKEITPWIAETWKRSPHARSGVVCNDCHGNHDSGFDSPEFTAHPGVEQCSACHPIRVKETLASKHGGTTKCTSCHPRHSFSLNVSRNPVICTTCHLDSLHVQGYNNSKMGVVYQTEGPGSSATCQSCHMPDRNHNVNKTLENRELMLKICNQCHSASFAGEVLSQDLFKSHW